jgi:hypothetical protein
MSTNTPHEEKKTLSTFTINFTLRGHVTTDQITANEAWTAIKAFLESLEPDAALAMTFQVTELGVSSADLEEIYDEHHHRITDVDAYDEAQQSGPGPDTLVLLLDRSHQLEVELAMQLYGLAVDDLYEATVGALQDLPISFSVEELVPSNIVLCFQSATEDPSLGKLKQSPTFQEALQDLKRRGVILDGWISCQESKGMTS